MMPRHSHPSTIAKIFPSTHSNQIEPPGPASKMTDFASANPARLRSLDQFRGYTMLGMLLVNYLGSFELCPRILRHTNNYCSYADTIMPQFLFAAGFAMRLSLGKRWKSDGRLPWVRVIRRILGLAMIAIVWYSICDLGAIIQQFRTEEFFTVIGHLSKRSFFQTLMHIAATSLWILPVIVASARWRLFYAAVSGLIHIVLSWAFNFAWVWASPAGIDGGPLGFLTWCVPALVGTVASDWVQTHGVRAGARISGFGLGLMLFGWLLSSLTVLYDVPVDLRDSLKSQKLASDPVFPETSRWERWNLQVAEPPFVPPPETNERKGNYWMMSQRAGSLSYTVFAAGVSLVVFALFLWVCDSRGFQLGIFRTLGTNSLAAYLLHDIASWIVSPWFPSSSSAAMTFTGFVGFTALVYGGCRLLEARKWYLRV